MSRLVTGRCGTGDRREGREAGGGRAVGAWTRFSRRSTTPSIATLSVHENGYRNLAYSLQKLDMRERARVATAEAQYPRNFPNASLHPREACLIPCGRSYTTLLLSKSIS